ncbi:MAG: PIN domain-containing protein [Bacillota bacterium]
MMPVLVDTTAIYAILNRADQNHQKAVETLVIASKNKLHLFTTNWILGESFTLLQVRGFSKLARELLTKKPWPVVCATISDEQRAREILLKQEDKAYSYTDAVSFSIMKRLGTQQAFSFDHHFEQFGYLLIHNLYNLE